MTEQSILVVDDEAPMRKLLSYNLKASGYAVWSAADGTEALKLIEDHPFDLLLLDINLPGPSGLQVLDAVRRRTAELPVLVLSGRARECDKVEALNRGADDYVSKPFGIAELLARITALLRRVRPGRSDRVSASHTHQSCSCGRGNPAQAQRAVQLTHGFVEIGDGCFYLTGIQDRLRGADAFDGGGEAANVRHQARVGFGNGNQVFARSDRQVGGFGDDVVHVRQERVLDFDGIGAGSIGGGLGLGLWR
jgi:CheY-like chemotaxis protein